MKLNALIKEPEWATQNLCSQTIPDHWVFDHRSGEKAWHILSRGWCLLSQARPTDFCEKQKMWICLTQLIETEERPKILIMVINSSCNQATLTV